MTAMREAGINTQRVDRSRRSFLRGRSAVRSASLRPPWTDEFAVVDNCTRCGKCIVACPEQILVTVDGGFPGVDFSRGSGVCTFCGDCASSCGEGVFDLSRDPAWPLKAVVDEAACLAEKGVHCECCRDICDAGALMFRPRLGAPPAPALAMDSCTGCGACIAVCPEGAISVIEPQQAEAVA